MTCRKRASAALILLVCSLALWAGAALTSCGRPSSGRAPDVVVIVIDALRADRLGAVREGEPLTPFLDELARRGTTFSRAYSTSSWTLPAVASLFTSRPQSSHGVTSLRSTLSATEVTLAERLGAAGYVGLGFSANPLIGSRRGFGQGFRVWRLYPGKKHDPNGRPLIRASLLRERLVAGLDESSQESESPIFVYAQFMEPHTPYDPPERFYARFLPPGYTTASIHEANRKIRAFEFDEISDAELGLLRSLYDAEIAYLDEELRVLFEDLDTRTRLDHAIVIITADHGEEFREHDWMIHGLSLFEESVRIPLIVLGEGVPAGQVVDQPVSLVDLAPTILELAGLPPEDRFEGRSLVPLMRGEAGAAGKDIVLELASKKEAVDIRLHAHGLVRNRTKVVIAPTGVTHLFDLDSDPGESQPRDPSRSPVGAALLTALQQIRAKSDAEMSAPEQRSSLSDEERDELRVLGYATE